jgi:hypothetical protein
VTLGPAPGGSLNLSGQRVDASYASVIEQSGIFTGDGGFQVDVDGRTRLIGGAIASTDAAVDAGRNVLNTAGIVTEDLHNRADYQGRGFGLTAGFGTTEGDPEYRGSRMGVGSDSGSAESVTRAGVSGMAGHADIRTGDASGGLAPIVDVQQLEAELDARVAITGEFGQQAGQAWGDYANERWLDALERGDTDASVCWAADGGCRSAGHLLIGGASGGLDGALGAGLSTQVAPRVFDALQNSDLPPSVQETLAMLIATTAGATVGGLGGAAAGYNEAANNAAHASRLCSRIPICSNLVGGIIGGSSATAVLEDDIAITGDPLADVFLLGLLEDVLKTVLFVSNVTGGERTEYPAETDTLPISTESPLQPINRPGRYETPAYAQEGWASELPIAGPVQGGHTSGGYQPVGTELIGGAVYSEESGSISGAPPIKWGAQEKHFPGHNSYTPGRSTMTSDPVRLAEKAGTGQQVGNLPVGVPGSKERVNFEETIGTYIDPVGNASPTTNGIIHYARDGIHIVPARP